MYNINDETLAVLPVNRNNCEILEKNANLIIKCSSLKVIEYSCEYFGVQYKNRVNCTYNFIRTRYKAPVVIEEHSRIIFFPLVSPKNENNLWISYNNILDYCPSKWKKETKVKFKNGVSINVPVSFYIFNCQYSKAARLYSSYDIRTSKKW